MNERIPVSVIVTTKNEEPRIGRCLQALAPFGEVIVVDSDSADGTGAIAAAAGARVVSYCWDGRYPKKRQWCLEHLETLSPWVFFVDADEIVTEVLVTEIRQLFFVSGRVENCAGFFVRGRYVWNGRILRHGMMNNKLCLIHRERMCFPIVDDLDIPGMGEIEGHYQPVRAPGMDGYRIESVHEPLLHHAYEDEGRWSERHERYARWEAEMTRRGAWPRDPVPWRDAAKRFLRRSRLRGAVMFCYSYIFKLGFLDGAAGHSFARSRARYADAVVRLSRSWDARRSE